MLVKDIMASNPVVVNVEDSTISDAISKMRETDIHQIPAVNGKKYIGMLNYREILRKRSLQLNAKLDTFIINTPQLSPDDDVREVIRLIKDTGVSAFPVIQKDKLVGLASRSDIIRHVSELPESQNLRNRQVMSSNPVTVTEDESVDSAAAKMRGLDEIEIPVVDRDGKLTGILRLDDIAADTFRRKKQSIRGSYMYYGDVGGDSEKVEVTCSSLMDNAYWVEGQDLISGAADIMIEHHLHIVPVVSSEMVLEGVVGIADIIDALSSGEEKTGMLIQVTGLDPDDRDTYEVTYAMASKFALRFSKITGLNHGKINIHVLRYHTEGRVKYSVRTKIIAEPLSMSLDHHDWNYGKCLSFIFETYEPRLRKWKSK